MCKDEYEASLRDTTLETYELNRPKLAIKAYCVQ